MTTQQADTSGHADMLPQNDSRVCAEPHRSPSDAIWSAIDAGLKRHASDDDMRRAAAELGRLRD